MSIIIAVSGRKQAGKNTLCDYLSADYESRFGKNFTISQDDSGKLLQTMTDTYVFSEWRGKTVDYISPETGLHSEYDRCEYGPQSKIYSFADPLKRFCIDVMGLREEQCYGTDADKNTETEYLWDNIEIGIRYQYGAKTNDGAIPRTGPMTGREVMQCWGTNIMRKMFSDGIWVNAALRMIHNDGYPISFISDMRFKSEAMALLKTKNAYVIRLQRKICEDAHESEKDLDDFDFKEVFGDRALVVDNQNMTIMEKNLAVVPFFNRILHDHSTEGLIAKKEAGEKNVS